MRTEKGWLLKFGAVSFLFFGLLFLLWSCSSKKNVVGTEKVGSIFVDSNVPNATIELDDSTTGKQTPYTFKNIKVGSHKVLVTKEGYNSTPEFETVKVEDGKEDTVEFTLTLINKVGAIWVNSDPQGAQIILDQINTQKTTPDTLDSVPVGEHTVSVKKKGYRTSPDTVEVVEDSLITVAFVLERLGAIFVNSDPSEAEIILNHVSTGMMTPDTIFDAVPETSYVVSVFKEAHSNDAPAKKVVNIATGDTVMVEFNLSPATVGPDTEGQLAPDFELWDDRDKLIKLYNYRGFVVIVNFWATSCYFCMLELPFLQELYDEYSTDDSLMIFAVNYGDPKSTIQGVRDDKNLDYHLLVGKDSPVLEVYNVLDKEKPITIIIDRSGLIYLWVQAYNSGTRTQMRTALSELFGH
jgi:peroxiredoxin